jgi:hypothetical protein
MAKIRISSKDKKEYNKLKNAVKSKVNRTKKNYGVNLENEVAIPSLSSFTTRKEFNEWKQKASSFTNRNNTRYQFRKNKNGLVQSVKQINEFKRLNRLERQHAKEKQKKIANLPFMHQGEQVGTVGQRFGMMKRPKNVGFSVPAEFNFDNFHSYYELERRKEIMQKRADPKHFDKRLNNFVERYIEGLSEMFNSDADDVIDKIRQIPEHVFYDMYLKYGVFQTLFDPSPQKGYVNGQEVDEGNNLRQLRDLENYLDKYLESRGENDIDYLSSFPNK